MIEPTDLDRINAAVDKGIQEWASTVDYLEIDDAGATFTTDLDNDSVRVKLRIWAERDGKTTDGDVTYVVGIDTPSQAITDEILVYLVRLECEAWCDGETVEDAAEASRMLGLMREELAKARANASRE